MKTLALFDFDGTLYKKDSLLEVTRAIVGTRKFYTGIFLLLPYLAGLKLRLIHNELVKVKFLSHYFKDLDYGEFGRAAANFAITAIEKDLDTKIYKSFIQHIEDGHTVYIVTASCKEWIYPWLEQKKVNIISSCLEIKHDKITGRLEGANCYGNEKVNRIKEVLRLEDFDSIMVYGKGRGDLEMLQLKK